MEVKETDNALVVDIRKVMPSEIAESMSVDDFPKAQVQFMLFSDYLKKYMPLTLKRKKKIEAMTYCLCR